MSPALLWLRRDLRLADNPAWQALLEFSNHYRSRNNSRGRILFTRDHLAGIPLPFAVPFSVHITGINGQAL